MHRTCNLLGLPVSGRQVLFDTGGYLVGELVESV